MSNTAWGTPGSCGQTAGTQPYGIRMPWTNTDMQLSQDRLSAISAWICAGAPGP